MKNIIITSSYTVEGYRITNYVEFISVEVVIGTGLFSEFKASFSDFFGSRSGAFQSKLSKIKALAVKELKKKAIELNGDAVISVDLDYTNFTKNIIGLIISGTVVRLKEDIESYKIIALEDEKNLVDINSPLYIKSKKIIKHLSEIKTKRLFVQFELLNPKMLSVEAIKFNLKLSTFFNESIDSDKSSEIVTNLSNKDKQKMQFEIKTSDFDIISHIDITIDKIGYSNKELWISSGNVIKPNFAKDDLTIYKNYFGIDANCYPIKNEESWICVCGNSNDLNSLKCSNCLRSKNDVLVSKDFIIQRNIKRDIKELEKLINSKIWNRVEKMHAKVIEVKNDKEVIAQNKYGKFKWKIADCDVN